VNEPVANACRTCGRWPSLFDLEESQLEEIPPMRLGAPAPTLEVEPEAEVTPVPIEDLPPEIDEPELADDSEAPSAQQWRRLLRFAVPVGVALYILISSALNH
jgi:hypothetical protein